MAAPKRIFIVGHMGAKKSLLGEALAEKLNWQYIDANPSLERFIGRSLEEVFGKEGEAALHQCEAEILSHYIAQDHVVVVLEEGVVTTAQNRKLLSQEWVVYSKVSISKQLEQIPKGRTPLLPLTDLKAFLEKQHLERDSLYEEVATVTVESSDIAENVGKIIKIFEE